MQSNYLAGFTASKSVHETNNQQITKENIKSNLFTAFNPQTFKGLNRINVQRNVYESHSTFTLVRFETAINLSAANNEYTRHEEMAIFRVTNEYTRRAREIITICYLN